MDAESPMFNNIDTSKLYSDEHSKLNCGMTPVSAKLKKLGRFSPAKNVRVQNLTQRTSSEKSSDFKSSDSGSLTRNQVGPFEKMADKK